MTVCHLITRLTLGGSARNTMDSAAATVRAGYRTVLATGPSGDEIDITQQAEGTGVEIVLMPSLQRSVAPVRDLKALVDTISLLRRERVQILHTHTSKAGFIGRLAGALAGVPVVIHSPHGHIFYGYYGRFATTFFVWLERLAARLSDRIVVLTDRGAEEHLSFGVGRPEQYVTIPSGVDTAHLRAKPLTRREARQRLGFAHGGRVLLGIGRLVDIKGFDLLVRALPSIRRAHADARVVLVGDGPDRALLQALAREHGVDAAFAIAGAQDDVSPYLAAADVLVVPSRNEGMGRVLVEAMALGVPVVATRVGGIPSVVQDGVCGVLTEPEDPASLAAGVAKVLGDDALYRSLEAGARAQAEKFSLPVMEARLIALYRELSRDKGLLAEALETR